MDEEIPQALIVMAYDMLAVGVKELERYDPEKEDALEAVARIYIAMELMRMLVEDGGVPPRGEKLN